MKPSPRPFVRLWSPMEFPSGFRTSGQPLITTDTLTILSARSWKGHTLRQEVSERNDVNTFHPIAILYLLLFSLRNRRWLLWTLGPPAESFTEKTTRNWTLFCSGSGCRTLWSESDSKVLLRWVKCSLSSLFSSLCPSSWNTFYLCEITSQVYSKAPAKKLELENRMKWSKLSSRTWELFHLLHPDLKISHSKSISTCNILLLSSPIQSRVTSMPSEGWVSASVEHFASTEQHAHAGRDDSHIGSYKFTLCLLADPTWSRVLVWCSCFVCTSRQWVSH